MSKFIKLTRRGTDNALAINLDRIEAITQGPYHGADIWMAGSDNPSQVEESLEEILEMIEDGETV